jgi:hypothetical protein
MHESTSCHQTSSIAFGVGDKATIVVAVLFSFLSFGLRSIRLVGLHFVARSGPRRIERLHHFDQRV